MRNKATPEELIIKELDATTQSTKDMLSFLLQTKEVGQEILKDLDSQGKQLGAVQDNVDKVLYEEKISKRKVRSISSLFWDIINWFLPDPSQPNHNKIVNNKIARDNKKENRKIKKAASKTQKNLAPEDILADALKDDPNKSKYDESEKMLDQMDEVVGDLDSMAREMGKEIHHHNTRLDMLDKTAKEAGINMGDLNGDVRNVLHK